jgi:hypothetical protein
MSIEKESCVICEPSKCQLNSSGRNQKKTVYEQRQIVKSLVEILENEKNILEQLEQNENPEEAEIADALVDELLCPISYAFMVDPVVLTSGKTYERNIINSEFERQKEQHPGESLKCPFTLIKQVTDVLTPNMQMRSITAKFVEKYKGIKHIGPSWTEIRRLCSDYLAEQEPQKVEERQCADEQRAEKQRRVEQQKKADEEEFEKQKMELKRRAEYGLEFEEFCLLYGEFFRFYQKTRKPLYTGYANKNHHQREHYTNTEVLRKWEHKNTKLLFTKQISGCLSIFMEYYVRKRGNPQKDH